MASLRAFLLTHRRLAAVLLAMALCMKAFMPAGVMLGQDATVLTVEICADASGGAAMKQIVIPHPGKGKAAKSSADCPYAGLGMAGLSTTDPVLLALALAFIIALGFAPIRAVPPRRVTHLRPPLRGPPAFA